LFIAPVLIVEYEHIYLGLGTEIESSGDFDNDADGFFFLNFPFLYLL
jgi:hypothetical protein